jgi:reactive intermediate/imine deaminase
MAADAVRRLGRVEGIGDPVGPYSHAVIAGSAVHVSGQVPIDASGTLVGRGDFGAQARQAYANLAAVLGAAGCDWDDVVKMTVYLTDVAHLAQASEVRREVVPEDSYPASTVVEVTSLADPEWLIEVEAVARLRG